jgi:hypothetical protein
MIEIAIGVPLALSDQLALERATHAVLDPHRSHGWRVSLTPFLTIPGCMLEIAVGRAYVERRVLDTPNAHDLENALRQVVRRRVLAREA